MTIQLGSFRHGGLVLSGSLDASLGIEGMSLQTDGVDPAKAGAAVIASPFGKAAIESLKTAWAGALDAALYGAQDEAGKKLGKDKLRERLATLDRKADVEAAIGKVTLPKGITAASITVVGKYEAKTESATVVRARAADNQFIFALEMGLAREVAEKLAQKVDPAFKAPTAVGAVNAVHGAPTGDVEVG